MSEQRTCKSCKGSGKAHHWDFQIARGEPANDCYSCRGKGTFGPPDAAAIIAAIKGRKGLRSAKPKDRHDHRAYYVWRMARFHGGADVTMPICAASDVRGDPWVDELNAIADAVAKRVYGTHLAAAHRWGRALGHLSEDMPGLPPTAYSSGPVLGFDAVKPDEELPELA